jgi:hypothetical protein
MTARSGLPRFSGGFRTFSLSLNTNREKATEDRLFVYSQGSRPKVHVYLWLKMIWSELRRDEWELFLAMPETLNNEIIYCSLRAINFQGKRVTRQKLINSPYVPKEYRIDYDRYRGYQRLNVEISRETRSLPKVTKFSGYVKSASAIGSKRSPGKSSILDLMTINNEDYSEIEFNWFAYLTVDD